MVIESTKCENSIKFLCSYGGKILPRYSDGKLRYVGGFTRVLAVDRSISYTELMVKLVEFRGASVTLKCQLPNGDLDTLISITSDEDLANIVEEYDRASSSLSHPLKIRAILSQPKLLKIVSPPPSNTPSVDFNFSAHKSSYAATGIYGHAYPNYTPAFSIPMPYRQVTEKVLQYPYLDRQIPRPMYVAATQKNRSQ